MKPKWSATWNGLHQSSSRGWRTFKFWIKVAHERGWRALADSLHWQVFEHLLCNGLALLALCICVNGQNYPSEVRSMTNWWPLPPGCRENADRPCSLNLRASSAAYKLFVVLDGWYATGGGCPGVNLIPRLFKTSMSDFSSSGRWNHNNSSGICAT
jgi:hypothetical protein